MTAVCLHVGYHKTATTFLQQRIFRPEKGYHRLPYGNSGELIDDVVLRHPSEFSAGAVRGRVEAELAATPPGMIPVVTREGLSGDLLGDWRSRAHTPARLAEILGAARVIIGIREQRSMIRSTYTEYVRQSGLWPLETFIGRDDAEPAFRPPCDLGKYHYDRLVGEYREVFGAERVLVLLYEELVRDPEAFQARVHAFTGSSAVPEGGLPPARPGLRAMSLGLQRRLNWLVALPPGWSGGGRGYPLGHRAASAIVRRFDRLCPRGLHDRLEARIRETIARRVGRRYAESNARLAEMTGLPLADWGYDLPD